VRTLLLAAVLGLALAEAADAHAFLVASSPARRAVLTHPPARAELWFNERLESAYSTLTVETEAGARVDQGDVRVGPDDPRKLSVTLPALEPGRYVVRFRVLSVDGHVVESSFVFNVK
jgi:methionine-rich copper-binding protein CopC